jgi:hypothetical protein
MTLTEAIALVDGGATLVVDFQGVETPFVIWVRRETYCDFPRRRKWEHDEMGPIHLRFWGVAGVQWLHISEKQLDGFLQRNFR